MHTQAFPPLAANRRDRPVDGTLELSELLRRAKAAIDVARDQVEKTQTLIEDLKQSRESESASGAGFMRR